VSEPALTLFADCPACRRNPVPDPREPCQECVTAFGPMIRRGDRQVGAGEFAAELERQEHAVAGVYAARRTLTGIAARGGGR
jgi:hypothetical protein